MYFATSVYHLLQLAPLSTHLSPFIHFVSIHSALRARGREIWCGVYFTYWTLAGGITLHCWWLSTGGKEGHGNRVKSNSQSSQYAHYLKVPPAFLSGNPLPSDHHGAWWGSKTSSHTIIYMLWIKMTDRLLGCSDIFKVSHKRWEHLKCRKIAILQVYISLSCFNSLAREEMVTYCMQRGGEVGAGQYSYVFMHVRWGCNSNGIISFPLLPYIKQSDQKPGCYQHQKINLPAQIQSGWKKMNPHHRNSVMSTICLIKQNVRKKLYVKTPKFTNNGYGT